MTRIDLPHFELPPINEVAIGVRFEPIDGLQLAHFGLFWSSLRDEFSKTDEAVPLGTIDDLAIRKGGLPLPRTWLIHKDEQYLIQLQPNIFYFNWRRLDETHNYPRYSTIKPLFYHYLQRYIEFLTEERLSRPESLDCNLTYVNIIPQTQNGDSSDGLSLFPDVMWRQSKERYLPTPTKFNWQTNFDLPDDVGELTAKIQSAQRVSDGLPVLRFEIKVDSAGSKLSLDDTDRWFDLAHQAIVLSFVDLTSGKTQREVWKRVNGTN